MFLARVTVLKVLYSRENLQILRFCGYLQMFSLKFGDVVSLVAPVSNLRKLSPQNISPQIESFLPQKFPTI